VDFVSRFIQQYALWRRVFKNRNRALRRAMRDCGINPERLFSRKPETGIYNHELNNWNWRT
jgi:hypothetical protein